VAVVVEKSEQNSVQ